MSTAYRLVMGIVIGILASLMTLAIAQIGVNLLLGVATIGKTVAIVTMLSGALLGVISVGLGYLTAGMEQKALVVLIGLILAALAVIGGKYGNGSIVPLGIYGLVMMNCLLICRMTTAVGERLRESSTPNLRG